MTQITVTLPREEPARSQVLEAFQTAAQQMTTCDQVDGVARQFAGVVVSNDAVALFDLPPQLREQIKARGIGQASDPFGMQEGHARIFLRCS